MDRQIVLKEKTYEKLKEISDKEFRTPELQLEFMLNSILSNPQQATQSYLLQTNTKPLVENKKSNDEAMFDKIAKIANNANTEDYEDESFASSRQAYEMLNNKKSKENRPTAEHLAYLAKHARINNKEEES